MERRGLSEIIAWSCSLVVLAVVFVAELVKTGQADKAILYLITANVSALLARGAQSAGERSARNALAAKREENARALEQASVAAASQCREAVERVERMIKSLPSASGR